MLKPIKSTKKQSKGLEELKSEIVRILKKHGIKKAGIFGSYARGEQKKNSDIDILIKYNDGLLKLVKIEMELQRALRKKVDLITYDGINPLLKEIILKDEVRVI